MRIEGDEWNGVGGMGGSVQFPHYDGFGVVEEVFADAGEVVEDGDAEISELLLWTDAGEQEQAAGVDCAGADDGFGFGGEGELGAGFQG